jgi:hypothetical protein
MESIQINKRLTYKYNTFWSNMDRWHELGMADLVRIGSKKTCQWGESSSQVFFVRVNLPYRPINVERALYDSFIMGGCNCQHDCCGHWSFRAHKVRPLKGGLYAVLVTGYRNV